MSDAGVLSRAGRWRGGSLRRVLVVGDIMLDEYVFGTVGRISPEAPSGGRRNAGNEGPGGAAKVAFNLRGWERG